MAKKTERKSPGGEAAGKPSRPNIRREGLLHRPETPGHAFHKKLRALIHERGYESVTAFAEAHGWDDYILNVSQVIQYAGGRSLPKIDALMRLAKALRVSPAYLADDDATEPNPQPGEVLSDVEKMIIKKCRTLGVEDAATVVALSVFLGATRAISRLTGQQEGGSSEGAAEEGGADRAPVLGGHDDPGDPAGGNHRGPGASPRKRR